MIKELVVVGDGSLSSSSSSYIRLTKGWQTDRFKFKTTDRAFPVAAARPWWNSLPSQHCGPPLSPSSAVILNHISSHFLISFWLFSHLYNDRAVTCRFGHCNGYCIYLTSNVCACVRRGVWAWWTIRCSVLGTTSSLQVCLHRFNRLYCLSVIPLLPKNYTIDAGRSGAFTRLLLQAETLVIQSPLKLLRIVKYLECLTT